MILTLLFGLLIILQAPGVQTLIVRSLTERIMSGTDADIRFSKVSFRPFNAVVIKDICVIDPNPCTALGNNPVDTLFSAANLSARFSLKGLFHKDGIYCSTVHLSDASFNLTLEECEYKNTASNLERIFGLRPNPDKPKSTADVLEISKIRISGLRYRMMNLKHKRPKIHGNGINWTDMDVQDINIEAKDFYIKGGYIGGIAEHLSLHEKSGLTITDLSGSARVGHGETLIKNLKYKDLYSSIDISLFRMTYQNSLSWSHFLEMVRMDGNIDRSHISTTTLGYFARGLQGKELSAYVTGDFHGYVTDFVWDKVGIDFDDTAMKLNTSGAISGLPDLKAMKTDIRINSSVFTTAELDKILTQFAKGKSPGFSKFATNEAIALNGRITGPLDNLHIKADLGYAKGSARTDSRIRNLTAKNRPMVIDCDLKTSDLDIGRIIGKNAIGRLSMHSVLSATLQKGSASIRIDSVNVGRLGLMGYDYSGIKAAGMFADKAFNGRIVCNDPNLYFLFQGIATLSRKTSNAVYQFYANLGYADLKALNIFGNRGTAKMSMQTRAEFTSVRGEDLIGNIRIKNLVLEDEHGKHEVGDIDISSHNNDDINRIRLSSDFAEASYVGSRFITGFIKELQSQTTQKHLPSLYRTSYNVDGNGKYNLSLRLHDTKDILAFFAPGVFIADSTALEMNMSESGIVKGRLRSHRLAYKDKYIKGLSADIGNDGKIVMNLTADEIRLNPLLVKNNGLRITAANDSVRLGYSYDNLTKLTNKGILNAAAAISRNLDNVLTLQGGIDKSSFFFNSRKWSIDNSSFKMGGGDINIDRLLIGGENQSLIAEGGISRSRKDTLSLRLDRFDLDILNSVFTKQYDLQGLVSGKVLLVSAPDSPKDILASLLSENTGFGGAEAGMVRLACLKDMQTNSFTFYGRNNIEGRKTFDINGKFFPSDKSVAATLSMDSFDLGHASPFLTGLLSGIEGSVSGKIGLNGPLGHLEINSSETRINSASAVLDFTKVRYNLSGPFHADNKGLWFDDILIRDRRGETGNISGKIGWDNFRNAYLDTRIDIDRIEVLNTTEKDNPTFYGNAYARGRVNISGPFNNIGIDINAGTTGNGNIHIPTGRGNRRSSDLLTFKTVEKPVYKDPYDEYMERFKAKEKGRNKLGVRLALDVNQDTEALLEIDKASGNVISGRGNGLIEIEVVPSASKFSLNGNYDIISGNYHFVALGIAKKDFSIQNGSSVRFNGDVMDTRLDIDALYKTKTSIGTLIADTTSVSTRRTVECGIKITDKLSNPRLDFSINIPDLDPTTKSRVEAALSTEDKIQKQFLSLVVSNSFMPDEQSGIVNTTSGSMLYSNVSEIMAGQLNNILQKLEIPLDLGLDYQQNSKGANIFDVAVSTALFNNRVLVNGSIGNRQYGNTTTGTGDVVGDIDIEIKIDKPGALRLKLFSHSADQYTNYLDNSQRNGVGVTYSQEYNNFKEFIRRLFSSKEKRREAEAARRRALQNEERVVIEVK